jgi:hypothetical protein
MQDLSNSIISIHSTIKSGPQKSVPGALLFVQSGFQQMSLHLLFRDLHKGTSSIDGC